MTRMAFAFMVVIRFIQLVSMLVIVIGIRQIIIGARERNKTTVINSLSAVFCSLSFFAYPIRDAYSLITQSQGFVFLVGLLFLVVIPFYLVVRCGLFILDVLCPSL